MKKTIEVPESWARKLIELADGLDNKSVQASLGILGSEKTAVYLKTDVAYLIGYIKGIDLLIKEDPDEE